MEQRADEKHRLFEFAKRNSQPREAQFFTRADVLLCRSEDVMWFEKSDGSRECLYPLSMEGFCVEGLLDYQFCQTSGTSFEMPAEIGESAEQITPDQHTGKKPLIIRRTEDKKNDKNKYYRKAI